MELTAAEGRVLGCLIELEAVAPAAVPFTLNALRLACNQPSGRVPVVAYDDRTVGDTLLALKSRGLARFVPPTDEVRTTRYRQRADERWRMGPAELAVLAVLLLRGVQTVAEVRTQVQRLHPAAGAGEVDAVLDALAARTPRPFAARVGRRADHETRWAEVLTAPAPVGDRDGVGDGDDRGAGGVWARARDGRREAAPAGSAGSAGPAEPAAPDHADLVARVADLEQRLAMALERRAPVAGDREGPAYPPPPPPVDVRSVAPGALTSGAEAGRPEPRHLAAGDHEARAAAPGPPARPGLAELAERLGDIERRLARIEAELGALR
jgi:uncharacterized protein YceH (UPF0502 family)